MKGSNKMTKKERARELGSEYLDDLECSVQNSTGAWIAWGIGRGDFENLCASIDDSDKITLRGVFSEYREELTGAEFKSLYRGAE